MTQSRAAIGSEGEAAVCRWIASAGFRILDRNWRRPWGELDIVAVRDDVIRFIEVKTSGSRTAGFEPYLRADGRKMAKVARTARTWLAANGFAPSTEWQLDVVSVIMNPQGTEFEHFENI